MYNFIAIEGNIGAGKTTLSTMLAKDLNARLVLEQFVNNPFLSKFYKDPEKYAFQLEMSFLSDRYKQMKEELSNTDMFKPVVISDYLLIKSKLFAQVNLKEDELHLFNTLFDIIHTKVQQPDLILFLECPVTQLQQNITKRARSYEQSIPDAYLQNISDQYWNYLKNTNTPTIVLDSMQLDFVRSTEDYLFIKSLLHKPWKKGINYLR